MRGIYEPTYSWPVSAATKPFLACIKETQFKARCRRDIEMNEFVFESPEHAVAHYADGKLLRACSGCVAAARPEIEKLQASYKSK